MRASDRAYRTLLDEIQSGALQPGAVLAEVEQSLRLGVSRTPLREALGRRAADGLVVQASARVTVVSDSADKAKIQQFFDDNPALVKQYQQIEALSGLDDARKAMQIAPSEMRKRIEVESMAAWWSGSDSSSSYFGSYSDGNMSVLAGLNLSV